MIVQGYIVPRDGTPGSPWVFQWARPQHVESRLPVTLPSPLQSGLPVVQGMPLLAGAVQAIIQPGNVESYGIVSIEFPDTAIVVEQPER